MRVRQVYRVESSGGQGPDLELPMALELGDGARATFDRDTDGSLRLTVEHPVARSALALEPHSRHFVQPPGGERRELAAVRVSGDAPIGASDVADILTFLTDRKFEVSSIDQPELLPDNDQDAAKLRDLGTTQVFVPTTFRSAIRTFVPTTNAGLIEALLPRVDRLRLYAHAHEAETDTAKYRDLWRVLESA